MDELSEEDNLTVARACKGQRFLSQPFFVAEIFTGTPGAFVDWETMLGGFEEILAGNCDVVPEAACMWKTDDPSRSAISRRSRRHIW